MKTKFLSVLLAVTCFSAAFGQTPDKARLDQFFDCLAEENQAMGTLAIVKDGKVLYSRAIGYSQIDRTVKKPMTMENKFRIASIGKTYSAAMILQVELSVGSEPLSV